MWTKHLDFPKLFLIFPCILPERKIVWQNIKGSPVWNRFYNGLLGHDQADSEVLHAVWYLWSAFQVVLLYHFILIGKQSFKKTLPEAQGTQGKEFKTWIIFFSWNYFKLISVRTQSQFWPPGAATCISSNFGQLVALLALVTSLATRWCHLH